MLKKKELDDFMIEVPPHHLADPVKIRRLFDMINEEPRPASYLAEKLGWNLANTVRFLTGSTYKDYFEDVGSIPPKVWRLRETAIRLKLTGYDAEVSSGALATARDENAPGHSYNPVPLSWFTKKFNFYPYFPIFHPDNNWDEQDSVSSTLLGKTLWNIDYLGEETHRVYDTYHERDQLAWGHRVLVLGNSELWPELNQDFYIDPFFTVCYLMTNARGSFKTRLRKELEACDYIHMEIPGQLFMSTEAVQFDNMLWLWTWHNLRSQNYTFFERDFSYLPSLWSGHVREEFTLHYSKNFIIKYISAGAVGAKRLSLNQPIEVCHESGWRE